MNGGKLEDGTPYVAIGAGEPEAREFVVHCACESCGKQHHFDLWRMAAGEPITCEHCGHVTRARVTRYVPDPETGELVEVVLDGA